MEFQEICDNVEKYFELDPKKDHALINILNPSEAAADCIVLSIGSSSIKLGVASQLQPFLVPNIIAYQHTKPQTHSDAKEEEKGNESVEKVINNVESDLRRKNYICWDPKSIKSQMWNLMGFKLFDESNCTEQHFNMDIDDDDDQNRFEQNLFSFAPEDYLWNKNFSFTKVSKGSSKQKYFVGEEAVSLHKTDNYKVFYPIRNGYLNVTSSHSIHDCIDALELILRKSIASKLKIPQKNFKYFRWVISIPDLINK